MEECRIMVEVTCVNDPEIDCISLCKEALSAVQDCNAKARVMQYLNDRYGVFVALQKDNE